MKIVIIGTGISGLSAAYGLAGIHDLTVLEAQSRTGGHTCTTTVQEGDREIPVDMGFIVFNHLTYPHFTTLLERLEVASRESSMSFSVCNEATGLEYNGTSLNTLFAQRRNLLSLKFHGMIRDILRFAKVARVHLDSDDEGRTTLREFLERHRFSTEFTRDYLVPMSSAIWSADPVQMMEFPITFLARFFENHRMLDVSDRPVWRVVQGGSRTYVEALTRPFRDCIHVADPAVSVTRTGDGVVVTTEYGKRHEADAVVMACHSDQALALINEPTEDETAVLSSIRYQANEAVLHTDVSVMPQAPLARASWNARIAADVPDRAFLTYDMNLLQGFESRSRYLVTLNGTHRIDPDSIIRTKTFHHPIFDRPAYDAQKKWGDISGRDRIHYCGAYWRYGFHEDGVFSARRVIESLGGRLW